MGSYESLLRPLLFRLDPEDAHHLASSAAPFLLPLAPLLLGEPLRYEDPALKTEIAGVQFANPVGLAAGFDKNAKLVPGLGSLGFGFAEVGSITANPSPGNPRPRLFRLPADDAVINRLGLNGEGCEAVAERLKQFSGRFPVPIAVNIAKTNDAAIVGDAAIADHLKSFIAIRDLPLAYITLNASCPNTHEGCMQARSELAAVLAEFARENIRHIPIFVKLSPDSSDQVLDEFVGVASEYGVRGFICGNTTVERTGLNTPAAAVSTIGKGGLSGPPLKEQALQLCRKVFALKEHSQQIIGCGGIATGADAFEFIKAGCTAVQLYTALIYHGPAAPARINRELAALIKAEPISVENSGRKT